MAPTKLPRYTSTHERTRPPVPSRPLAHAMTSRLLPVNSSAPPTTTSTRPRLKTTPARTQAGPAGDIVVPVRATVANTPPSAMKAPASTASARVRGASMVALRTPTSSARRAISAGRSASKLAPSPPTLPTERSEGRLTSLAQVPAPARSRTIGEPELAHGGVADGGHGLGRRIGEKQPGGVARLDRAFLDELVQQVDQWTPERGPHEHQGK